jgi:cysteine desulfurase
MTINASKIYGPKASGLLYKNHLVELEPIIFGGGQENNLRSGTENVASWIGLTKALELAQRESATESKRLISLRDYLKKELLKIPKTLLNGPIQNRLPNNINIIFENIEGEAMILHLDKLGISASTGSACHSKSLQPSHVLTAIGRKKDFIHGSLRLTMGKYTNKEQIKYLIKSIKIVVEKLRKISATNP